MSGYIRNSHLNQMKNPSPSKDSSIKIGDILVYKPYKGVAKDFESLFGIQVILTGIGFNPIITRRDKKKWPHDELTLQTSWHHVEYPKPIITNYSGQLLMDFE